MIWQAAYAELVFLDEPWPDVDRRHLWRAVETYARRDRRYGGAVDKPRSDLGLTRRSPRLGAGAGAGPAPPTPRSDRGAPRPASAHGDVANSEIAPHTAPKPTVAQTTAQTQRPGTDAIAKRRYGIFTRPAAREDRGLQPDGQVRQRDRRSAPQRRTRSSPRCALRVSVQASSRRTVACHQPGAPSCS